MNTQTSRSTTFTALAFAFGMALTYLGLSDGIGSLWFHVLTAPSNLVLGQ